MKKTTLVLLLIFGCAVFAGAQTVDTTDNVGWSDLTLIVPLTKRDEGGKRVDAWSLNLGGGFRMGRDLKRPIDERALVTFNYRINKYFTAGTGYMYRRHRWTESQRLYEHRLLFFLNAEKKWPNVILRNRALTTYLIKHSRSDTVVYRNRVQVSFPIKQKEKEVVSPYFATEPFYDFSLKKWFRNDIHIGITRQFTKKFGADFFYLHQGINIGSLRTTNGFGMSFRYRIDRVK
ncbi:MAG TPA: DUF2490 domain-containing protein [Pyrinomonadaceae bacterium]|nr:DUF2490 domain-containing protein [Pyrinomonadaceae bacterium]